MLEDEIANVAFRYDERDEHSLTFVALEEGRPDRPLMRVSLFTPEKYLATAVWLGERQHLWREWRAIAEAADGAALGEHLAELLHKLE